MKPNKPGWFWIGILGPEPEVVHVFNDEFGDLVFQRVGQSGQQFVKWTIDAIWGNEVVFLKDEEKTDNN